MVEFVLDGLENIWSKLRVKSLPDAGLEPTTQEH